MPIHDWTRAADLYLHFRHAWLCELCDVLNKGGLPPGHFALIEQRPGSVFPMGRLAEGEVYAGRPNHVAVHAGYGQVVAVIEVITPGNKFDSRTLRAIGEPLVATVRAGVHLLLIDLIPPSSSNPRGIHPKLCEALGVGDRFELPPDKPLTVAAYRAGPPVEAYVEPVAVGDVLPQMPIFIRPDAYVPAPLEESYSRAWEHCPEVMKAIVTTPPA